MLSAIAGGFCAAICLLAYDIINAQVDNSFHFLKKASIYQCQRVFLPYLPGKDSSRAGAAEILNGMLWALKEYILI